MAPLQQNPTISKPKIEKLTFSENKIHNTKFYKPNPRKSKFSNKIHKSLFSKSQIQKSKFSKPKIQN